MRRRDHRPGGAPAPVLDRPRRRGRRRRLRAASRLPAALPAQDTRAADPDDAAAAARRVPGRAGPRGGGGVPRRLQAGRHDRRRGRDRRRRRERDDGTQGRPRRPPSHRRARGQRCSRPRTVRRPGVDRVRRGSGRLRLGLPQGRPRQRRRGRVALGGTAASSPPRPAVPRARDPRTGSSPTSAGTGFRSGVRARRPPVDASRSSATPQASSTRSRATGSTRRC